ncbi:MAG: hypothetical protein M3081_14915 [Gemmatimonadota bacterium]|nr:hypothetical protein [Gemmatimonadota bacterium]
MIRLDLSRSLSAGERYGLDTLLDLARVVQIEDPAADVVRVRVRDDAADDDIASASWTPAIGDGEIILSAKSLAFVVDVTGMSAEQHASQVDRFGRVRSVDNPLVTRRLEREPVVSHGAVALRQAIVKAAGRRATRFATPWPNGRRWAAAFTHDLDVVALWPVFTALRLLELAKKKEAKRMLQVASAAVGAVGRAPVWRAVAELLAIEARHGIASTWFVLCGAPSTASFRRGDLTYDPDSPAATRILRAVREAGHEIGLHGSFATVDDPHAFVSQRAHLARIVGAEIPGVRQHFLRMRLGDTQNAMKAAGFDYDATLGFPDRNGFRLGVADVVEGWDASAGRANGLAEIPFTWMDRSLSKYRGVEDPAEWGADAIALADTVRAVEGCWVGIWHPNLAAPLGFPGAPAAWDHVVSEIVAREPFVGTLSTIVGWRRARRSARAIGVSAAGVVDARASGGTSFPLALEHGDGRPAEQVVFESDRRAAE